MAKLFLLLVLGLLFGSRLCIGTFPHSEFVVSAGVNSTFGSVVVRHLETNTVVITWSETNSTDPENFRILGKIVPSDDVVSFEVTTDTIKTVEGQSHSTSPNPDGFFVFFVSATTSFFRSYDSLGNPKSDLVNMSTPNSCRHPVSSYLSNGNTAYACFMPTSSSLYLALISANGSKIVEKQRSCPDKISSLHVMSSGQSVALTAQLNQTNGAYLIFNHELLFLTDGLIVNGTTRQSGPGIFSPEDNSYTFLVMNKDNNLAGINIEVEPRLELLQLRSFNWSLVNGGTGWQHVSNVESRSEVVPQRKETTVWRSSYSTSYRRTEFDLLGLGYSIEELDNQPPVIASEWIIGTGEFYEDTFSLRIELLNGSKHVMASKFTGLINTTNSWQQIALEFSNYGPGLRYLKWEETGKDTEFWNGYYGPTVDAPSITITIPPSISIRNHTAVPVTPNLMSYTLISNGEGLLYWISPSSSGVDLKLTKIKLTNEDLLLGYQVTLNANSTISSLLSSLQTSVAFWRTGGAAAWGEIENNSSVLKLVIYTYNCENDHINNTECSGLDCCLCPEGFVFNTEGGCVRVVVPSEPTPTVPTPLTTVPTSLVPTTTVGEPTTVIDIPDSPTDDAVSSSHHQLGLLYSTNALIAACLVLLMFVQLHS